MGRRFESSPRHQQNQQLSSNLDEDGQVDFKGKAKAFLRSYGFLSAILPYTNAEWEKLSIFLNFLVAEAAGAKSLPRSDFNEEGQLFRNQ